MAESCKGCIHWRYGGNIEFCHYMLDTGIPRNCPAENCLFYFRKMYQKNELKENSDMKDDYIEIPDIVDDAVLEMMERLEKKLLEYDEMSEVIKSQINELTVFHNDFIRCDAN